MSGPAMALNHPRFTLQPSKYGCLHVLGLVPGLLLLGGCKAGQPVQAVAVIQDTAGAATTQEKARMWMTVGERRFAITLADNETAGAFVAQLPLTLDMIELNGNEKYAEVPQALPSDASRPGTIHHGDLMIYGSSTVVVFYKTFRSSYSYTRLGRVEDPSTLSQALGQSSRRVTFSEN